MRDRGGERKTTLPAKRQQNMKHVQRDNAKASGVEREREKERKEYGRK